MVLLIVDPQVDFVSGPLAVEGAPKAMKALAEYMAAHRKEIKSIVVTMDQHPAFAQPPGSTSARSLQLRGTGRTVAAALCPLYGGSRYRTMHCGGSGCLFGRGYPCRNDREGYYAGARCLQCLRDGSTRFVALGRTYSRGRNSGRLLRASERARSGASWSRRAHRTSQGGNCLYSGRGEPAVKRFLALSPSRRKPFLSEDILSNN